MRRLSLAGQAPTGAMFVGASPAGDAGRGLSLAGQAPTGGGYLWEPALLSMRGVGYRLQGKLLQGGCLWEPALLSMRGVGYRLQGKLL